MNEEKLKAADRLIKLSDKQYFIRHTLDATLKVLVWGPAVDRTLCPDNLRHGSGRLMALPNIPRRHTLKQHSNVARILQTRIRKSLPIKHPIR